MDVVDFSKVKKQLKKIPSYVVDKLVFWASEVEQFGLKEVRRVPGYHDEPLKGKRTGERSIRLSKAYRAIYVEEKDGTINVVLLKEVNKHEY